MAEMGPHADPHLYPVWCGPMAVYPVEAAAQVEYDVFCRPPSGDALDFSRAPLADDGIVPCPPPIVTSTWTHENWEEGWYPSMARNFAQRARQAGWQARLGFARGWVPGRAGGTWVIRDSIGCWVSGRFGRAVMVWERDPEAEFSARRLEKGPIRPGEIPSGQQWKAKGAHVVGGRSVSVTTLESWMRGEL